MVSLCFCCCMKSRSCVQPFCLQLLLIMPLQHVHCTSPGQSCDPTPVIPGRGTSSSRACCFLHVCRLTTAGSLVGPSQKSVGPRVRLLQSQLPRSTWLPIMPSGSNPTHTGPTSPGKGHGSGPSFLKADAVSLKFLFSQDL